MVSKVNIPLIEEGFLLRSVDYRDKDRILSFLTRDHGRLDFIALGAKKSQKRFAGSLDFLNLLKIYYQMPSRGELNRLDQVEFQETYPGIRKDFRRTVTALEWLRLLYRSFPPENPIPGFLEFLREHFEALETLPTGWVDVVFRRKTLSQLGYHLNLDHCLVCRKQGKGPAYFSLSQGGLLCEGCRHGSSEGNARIFFPDSWWNLNEPENPWSEEALKQAESLLEEAYEDYLHIPPGTKIFGEKA